MRPESDPAALWVAIDEVTEGCLYALRFECEQGGWTPHLWSQTPAEGAPSPFVRLFFIGIDTIGKTAYYDTILIRDTSQLAARVKISEITQEAARATKRIKKGLDRMDQGLDPYVLSEKVRELN